MLKFSKPGFNSTWTENFQMFKLGLEKAEEPETKLPTSAGLLKKQENQKNIYFCLIDYAKVFEWITTNCGKFFKRREYQTTWPTSWEICMHFKKKQLEPDMEQQTGSNLEYVKAIKCLAAYLTYMPSTSCKMLG